MYICDLGSIHELASSKLVVALLWYAFVIIHKVVPNAEHAVKFPSETIIAPSLDAF